MSRGAPCALPVHDIGRAPCAARARVFVGQIIEEHGGSYDDAIHVGDTTHLLTTPAEVDKKKKSARLKQVPPVAAEVSGS